jgi:hypothetical protein
MKNKLIIGAIMVVLAGFYSCQKSDRLSNSPSLATTLTATVAEVIGNQVSTVTGATEHCLSLETFDGHGYAYILGNFSTGNYGIPNYGLAGIGHFKFGIPHLDSCAVVTVSSETYPKEIVIEYDSDCSASRERFRPDCRPEFGPGHGPEMGHVIQGKIIIDISDSLKLAGSTETITYQDFYIDSMKIDFNATLKNLGKNAKGNWVVEKEYNQTITRNNVVCVRKNKETQEWISGFGTRDRSDNKYYLSGNGSVSVNDTAIYSKTIITPLLFDASCNFISSGVVELTKNGSTATINYGDGTCDNKATVTIDGTTEEINLHSFSFPGGGRFGHHFHGFGKRD